MCDLYHDDYIYGYKQHFNGDITFSKTIDKVQHEMKEEETHKSVNNFMTESKKENKGIREINDTPIVDNTRNAIGGKKPNSTNLFKVKSAYKSKYF